MVQVSYRRVTGQLQECYRYISVLNISVPNISVLNIPYYRVNIERFSMLHLFFLLNNISSDRGGLEFTLLGRFGGRPASPGVFFDTPTDTSYIYRFFIVLYINLLHEFNQVQTVPQI